MLTELRLLLLENDSRDFILPRLSEDDAERLESWYGGGRVPALDAFLWCVTKGEASYGSSGESKAFDGGSAELGLGRERLYELFSSHSSLFYTGSPVKRGGREGKGRFIVLEGLDGAGKTTHIGLLHKRLSSDGRAVYATAEPTATSVGGIIRDALGGRQTRCASELAALFCADRVNHNTNPRDGIINFIDRGIDVICDRYYYSSMAYQGIDSDLGWVATMNLSCPEILKPDACVFLDLSAEKCAERISKTRYTSEIYETVEMIRKVKRRFADTFRMLNETENIYIINTDREQPLVAAEIYSIVKEI